MSKKITTEILIRSTPEKIWSLLTAFDAYPDWNPFIQSVKGEAKAGSKLQVNIVPPGEKGMSFKPTVRTCNTNRELSWLGHLLFPGLFDGEHKFELIDHKNGTTTLRQSETFKGILIWLLNAENITKGFESMNGKLKELAEEG